MMNSLPYGHPGALSALRALKNYNNLLLPPDIPLRVPPVSIEEEPESGALPWPDSAGHLYPGPNPYLHPVLLGAQYIFPDCGLPVSGLPGHQQCPGAPADVGGAIFNALLSPSSCFDARRRGEKRPIPEAQKDEKYFERRKRNNQAAKKSRDARKIREDQIALRACILEHENASLRAHLLVLKEEIASLRKMHATLESKTKTPSRTTQPCHSQQASSTTADL